MPTIEAIPVKKQTQSTTRTFDEYCELGRQAARTEEAGKWWLCDVAAAVVAAFPGRHTLRDFAAEVGIAHSTARERARVGRRFTPDVRKKIWPDDTTNVNVHYSHARDSLAIPDVDHTLEWLAVVSSEDYSVDVARAKLPVWMAAKGLEIADSGDDNQPPSKVTVVAGVATHFKALDKVDNVWKLTLVLDESDPVAEQLSMDLAANYKNRMLKLTLSE